MVKLVALLSFNGLIEKDISRHEISGEKISSRGWRSEESLELSVRAERPKNIEQRLEEQGEP